MKRLLLGIALAVALAAAALPQPAVAGSAWECFMVTYSPYSRVPVGGPFETFSDCMAFERGIGLAPSGKSYQCQIIVF